MNGKRMCTLALSAASAVICSAPPASAAHLDGDWSMTAVTTRGHCGTIPIGMGITGGRIHSTGGHSLSIRFSWAAAFPARGRSI
jgi:hypothetical protein